MAAMPAMPHAGAPSLQGRCPGLLGPSGLLVALALFLLLAVASLCLMPIGKACVAKPGTDGENAPVRAVLDVRQLAQALHDRIVVHHDQRFVLGDLGDAFAQARWQVEATAFPITRQVLGAACNRAILVDHAGATDADQRSQGNLVLPAPIDQLLEHADQLLYGIIAFDVLFAVPPQR